MSNGAHRAAVKLALARWYAVQSPSADRCMDGAIMVYLNAMKRAGWRLVPTTDGGGAVDMIAAFWRHKNTKPKEGDIAALLAAIAAAPDPTGPETVP